MATEAELLDVARQLTEARADAAAKESAYVEAEKAMTKAGKASDDASQRVRELKERLVQIAGELTKPESPEFNRVLPPYKAGRRARPCFFVFVHCPHDQNGNQH